METRELTYFVAVADELHFGRAAHRLGMAQPPLSRAIRRLESRLGVLLFTRTSRAVTLTEPGSVLLREARIALTAVEAAERRTRRAAREAADRPSIALATKTGASNDLLTALLNAYAAEAAPDAASIDVLLCSIGEQEPMLRDGRADVAILHLPYDSTTGLDYEELGLEGQMLIVPAGHPLGARSSVRLADLDEHPELPLARWPRRDGTYSEGPGPEVRDTTQLMQLIALGRAAAIIPESAGTRLSSEVAGVSVTDADTVTTVIAWPPHSRSLAVAQLIRVATDLSTATKPNVPRSSTSERSAEIGRAPTGV